MRVYRPKRKTKTGQMRPYAKWYVEFKDHTETTRRLPAFGDKKPSEELGRKLEKLVMCRANGELPDRTLTDWLESMPPKLRDKLAKIGLLDARNVAAGKMLAEHLDDFQQSLVAKGDTEKHARLVADFHALRHTFITNLANSGTYPKIAQLLARHSTITLTMDRYTHSLWEDLGEALCRLPDLSQPTEQTARATGTFGRENVAESEALCGAREGTFERNAVQRSAVNTDKNPAPAAAGKPQETPRETADIKKRNGRSAWELNPARHYEHATSAVLKTVLTVSKPSRW